MKTQQYQYESERDNASLTPTKRHSRWNYTHSLLFWAIVTAGLTFLILVVTTASLLWVMSH